MKAKEKREKVDTLKNNQKEQPQLWLKEELKSIGLYILLVSALFVIGVLVEKNTNLSDIVSKKIISLIN